MSTTINFSDEIAGLEARAERQHAISVRNYRRLITDYKALLQKKKEEHEACEDLIRREGDRLEKYEEAIKKREQYVIEGETALQESTRAIVKKERELYEREQALKEREQAIQEQEKKAEQQLNKVEIDAVFDEGSDTEY